MKRFISIPNHFKGVGEFTENLIFPAIIDRHAEGFITCYKKADHLFKRLSAVQEQFKVSYSLKLDLSHMRKVTVYSLKRQSGLQQTPNFGIFFPIFDKNKVRYYMRIVCQQTILMKYHALFVIFEKRQNLKLSSAANYR